MRRRHRTGLGPAALALLVCGGPVPAGAQGMRIHMHGDAPYAADGYLYNAAPDASDGLLLIPGKGGVSPAVQAAAQAYVSAGYEVVVLDPNRSGPPGQAAITDETTAADVDSALSFLAKQTNLRSGQVAVVGFGRGARFALRLATAGRVKAAVIEGTMTEAALELSAAAPVLSSIALAAPSRKRPGPAAPGLRYFPLRAGAATDEDDYFSAADLEVVRHREIDFLKQAMHTP